MPQMRIPKFPHLFHMSPNMHMALPPPGAPLPPAPIAGWFVIPTHVPGPLIYGKYTDQHVASEGMWNTLFGFDWGPPGGHVCLLPTTHIPTPSALLVMLGAGHKFWLPSYSVKEPASGGLLAMIGGSSTTAVAVCWPVGFIIIQDCQDKNGLGFVAPVGFNASLPTTHWVGFSWSTDFLAGLASLAMDCLGAILLSKLSNGRWFSRYGDVTKAVIGLTIGVLGSAAQGALARANAPPWVQIALGVVLIGLDVAPTRPDHTGPIGTGLAGGGLADLIGGEGTSGNPRGEHDPYFDPPPSATPPPAPPPAPPPTPPPAPPPSSTAPPPSTGTTTPPTDVTDAGSGGSGGGGSGTSSTDSGGGPGTPDPLDGGLPGGTS